MVILKFRSELDKVRTARAPLIDLLAS